MALGLSASSNALGIFQQFFHGGVSEILWRRVCSRQERRPGTTSGTLGRISETCPLIILRFAWFLLSLSRNQRALKRLLNGERPLQPLVAEVGTQPAQHLHPAILVYLARAIARLPLWRLRRGARLLYQARSPASGAAELFFDVVEQHRIDVPALDAERLDRSAQFSGDLILQSVERLPRVTMLPFEFDQFVEVQPVLRDVRVAEVGLNLRFRGDIFLRGCELWSPPGTF